MKGSETHEGGRAGTAAEVFGAFLRLGLTSFGGPIAHLGYFRDALVLRRKWLDEKAYADLVALCQFLPGPASSQVGFALGYMRAGPLGAAAAWTAFTLPSAFLLFVFALFASALDNPLGQGLLHGLKIVAVAVVAQAVWGMARSLCPDRARAGIALAALVLVTVSASAFAQIGAIAIGALLGWLLCRGKAGGDGAVVAFGLSKRAGATCLILFAILLLGLPLVAPMAQGLSVFDTFYRAGALVFGGGHVVLPLLEAGVVEPGWATRDAFLAGYGAAQAVPGPLFTFAAYLGAVLEPAPNGLAGAAIALIAVFLPGFLLLLGVAPFWDRFRQFDAARALMMGTNAAVVGILGAALYDPLWTTAILAPADFAVAAVGFILLTMLKAPPWVVVALCAVAGVALAAL
ncbi:chromate efflux transporter [Nitratireductor sp. L1-7-SE]|uniref:Chromate efflux transporter n=1 Tax=Nitratireductor rhodophyticola TaxID=2854036 RepID=A0ABS7R6Y0_9HYPH|nr:chromate efflux transporter [Nitratireductor rhodophyticola]MBY8916698.1 chromate efflux transporter [Nitratireductor rhodophyticola]MBY8922062.1 chromate efflux transporter [Nitratireductor rhodophyticola]